MPPKTKTKTTAASRRRSAPTALTYAKPRYPNSSPLPPKQQKKKARVSEPAKNRITPKDDDEDDEDYGIKKKEAKDVKGKKKKMVVVELDSEEEEEESQDDDEDEEEEEVGEEVVGSPMMDESQPIVDKGISSIIEKFAMNAIALGKKSKKTHPSPELSKLEEIVAKFDQGQLLLDGSMTRDLQEEKVEQLYGKLEKDVQAQRDQSNALGGTGPARNKHLNQFGIHFAKFISDSEERVELLKGQKELFEKRTQKYDRVLRKFDKIKRAKLAALMGSTDFQGTSINVLVK